MRMLLLTGPGGDAQGWGDMKVTESVRQAAESLGHPTRIAYVADEDAFFSLLDKPDFDIVWSALYHISPNEAFIGRNAEGTWVADVLDERRIPYIGSDSRAMRAMIDKFRTHEILDAAGVAAPAHVLLRARSASPTRASSTTRPSSGGASPSSSGSSTSRPWSRNSCPATNTRPSSSAAGRPGNACPGGSPWRTSTTGTTAS